jgi:hypothetical protein
MYISHLSVVIFGLLNVFENVNAQSISYQFSKSNSTYQPLTSYTSIIENSDFSDKNIKIPTTFPYLINGFNQDSLTIWGNGFVQIDDLNEMAIVLFNCYGSRTDSTGNFTSSIRSESSGIEGNKILKIQFSNLSMISNSPDDFLNYQIWLYENNSKIEFRIGNNYFVSQEDLKIPLLVGIINQEMDTENIAVVLNGNPLNPTKTLISIGTTLEFQYLNYLPPSGTIYTLIPN